MFGVIDIPTNCVYYYYYYYLLLILTISTKPVGLKKNFFRESERKKSESC